MQLSDKAQASLSTVVSKFQSGDLGAITTPLLMQLDPTAPASRWTMANRVLAFAQKGSLDLRTFNQWKEVGRTVTKGSRAAFILGPRLATKEDDKGEKTRFCVGFFSIPVFALEDTEGEAVPAYTPRKLPPLLDVAQAMGLQVMYAPLEGALGAYNPSLDRIRLATDEEAVFFHELAHAAHKRVNGTLIGGQDEHQEVVADFTSAVLMHLYGLGDSTGNTWRYISHYASDPLTAIMKALSEVEKVLAVLGFVEAKTQAQEAEAVAA